MKSLKATLKLGSSSNRYAPRLPQQETKSSTKQLAPTDPILGPEKLLKTGFAQKGLPARLGPDSERSGKNCTTHFGTFGVSAISEAGVGYPNPVFKMLISWLQMVHCWPLGARDPSLLGWLRAERLRWRDSTHPAARWPPRSRWIPWKPWMPWIWKSWTPRLERPLRGWSWNFQRFAEDFDGCFHGDPRWTPQVEGWHFLASLLKILFTRPEC